MFYNAKNGVLEMDGTTMNYISFGSGKRKLVMLPGLGDGLKTVKGMALPFALMYREFAKDFTVYVFSRKNELKAGYTIRDIAHDVKKGMDMLGIEKADIVGVSQGGMIAQHLAIDFPKRIGKLVLVVTIGRQNPCIQECIGKWISLAKQNRYGEVMKDVTLRMYTKEYIDKYRFMVPLLSLYPPPKNKERFIIMAESCVGHDAYDKLKQIGAPTLIIGGERDETVSGEASRELAEKIPGSELYMYEEYGHGLYSEAKDFNERVIRFLWK